MKDISYYIGVVVGFLFVVGFGLLIRFTRQSKRLKPEFDERQVAARGKAYKAGFFTLLIYGAVRTALQAFGVEWCSGLVFEVIGIVIGAGVFAVVAINNDAYLGFNEDNRHSMIILSLIGVLNLACGIIGIITDGLWKDGEVPTSFVNLLISVLFLAIVVTNWLHKKKENEIEEVEEE